VTPPVLIDARIGRKMTGVGYYTHHLLQEFAAVDPQAVRPIVKRRHVARYRALGLRPWATWRRQLLVESLPDASVIHGPQFHALPHPNAVRVATIHDLGYIQLPECHPPGMGERLDGIVRESLPVTALYLCDSDHTRRDFIERYGADPSRCRVVHLGVASRFSPAPPRAAARRMLSRRGVRGRYLLHVGAMVPRKDLGTLMDAFGQVARLHPDVHVVLAGNKTKRWASDWPKVQAWLAAERELADRVHVLNYTPDRYLPDLYRGAAASVSTSLLEGFGLTVLEALACGTPVVASGGSAVEEYAGGAVEYGTPRQSETYAAALDRVLSGHPPDPEKGLAVARAMTWRKAANETLAGYRLALDLGPPS
jgi:glycosyltransferase involved in cell wall biosynthesis